MASTLTNGRSSRPNSPNIEIIDLTNETHEETSLQNINNISSYVPISNRSRSTSSVIQRPFIIQSVRTISNYWTDNNDIGTSTGVSRDRSVGDKSLQEVINLNDSMSSESSSDSPSAIDDLTPIRCALCTLDEVEFLRKRVRGSCENILCKRCFKVVIHKKDKCDHVFP